MPKKIDKDKIDKILVIRTDRMGDALLNIPAIRALKRSFDANIVALLDPAVKELFTGNPEIERILTFDAAKWNSSLSARLKTLRQIRKEKFDLAVILNPARRFHVLTYLAGIPYRLGYDRKCGFLLTHKIEDKKFLGQKHEVEYNLDLARSIGANTDDTHISINVDEKDKQVVDELLLKYGIKDSDLLFAIHPFSGNPAKCWPKENFIHIADEFNRRLSAKVAIIGGPEKRSASIKLAGLAKYPLINLAGKLNLRELAAFLKRSTLLISNDSGPVHIAAAVGTCCLVIFGRNIPGVGPKRWGPWGRGHIALHKDPGCKPCLDRKCPYGFKCLTSISPEEVLKAVEKQINAHINY